MIITGLIWDNWNVGHIARHAVTPEEVEAVCSSQAFTSKTYADRVRVIGSTRKGRKLTVILAPKGGDAYYPVTARPASRKERKRYAQLKGGEKKPA